MQKLLDTIAELNIIREANNKEMIGLETELQTEKQKTVKALEERDVLISAMDELTEKCTQVEKTCDQLSKDNKELGMALLIT